MGLASALLAGLVVAMLAWVNWSGWKEFKRRNGLDD
jgi:hypothetical protein